MTCVVCRHHCWRWCGKACCVVFVICVGTALQWWTMDHQLIRVVLNTQVHTTRRDIPPISRRSSEQFSPLTSKSKSKVALQLCSEPWLFVAHRALFQPPRKSEVETSVPSPINHNPTTSQCLPSSAQIRERVLHVGERACLLKSIKVSDYQEVFLG